MYYTFIVCIFFYLHISYISAVTMLYHLLHMYFIFVCYRGPHDRQASFDANCVSFSSIVSINKIKHYNVL